MNKIPLIVDPMEFERYTMVDIPGICPGRYAVSNFGNMYSIYKHRPMKLSVSKEKCYTVGLVTKPGESKTFNLDYIVAKTYIPNPNPEVMTKVCHKNGVQADCFVGNMFWADQESYNVYNKYTDPEYEFKHVSQGWKGAKLDVDTVKKIRFLGSKGCKPTEIIGFLGLNNIGESAVRQVVNGNTFKNIE